MKRNRNHALSFAAALILCAALIAGCSPLAGAQDASSAPPQKIIKARFEVLHMMYQSIQVRSVSDMREIHTFTYAPAIRDDMQSVFNAGGYQYGDKVEVWYKRGEDVALKIKGKASRTN
jgi:hypothetical protein